MDESRHKGGSGLGLSIAKWIIEQHGGSISVSSTLGSGTIFTIKLQKNKMRMTRFTTGHSHFLLHTINLLFDKSNYLS